MLALSPIVGCLLVAGLIAGCGRQPSGDATDAAVNPTSFRQTPPEQYLTAVFTRYRNAASYSDDAQVRISYEFGGRWETQTAPLRVWLDQSQLYVEAYRARLWHDGESVTGWIEDPESRHFDSQVLKVSIEPGQTRTPDRPEMMMQPETPMQPRVSIQSRVEGRPRLETVLSDPILSDQLGAGMAGPPPQLEWLLAATPMERLFQGEHRFAYGPEDEIGGHACVSVDVVATGERFRFWVDHRGGVIRRVDLPEILRHPESEDARTVQASIDLIDATFEPPSATPTFAALPSRPQFVDRLIPLPPPPPSPLLGQRADSFRERSVSGDITLTERGSDRPLTLLIHCSDDAPSAAAIATVRPWVGMMPASLRNRLRVLLVADDLAIKAIPEDFELPVLADRSGRIASAYRMKPTTVVILRTDGSVGWVQHGVSPESLVNLGATIADLLRGVDVPKRVEKQWQAAQEAYRNELEGHRVVPK